MTFKEQCALRAMESLIMNPLEHMAPGMVADFSWRLADLMDAERCARTKGTCAWCAGRASMAVTNPGVKTEPCPDHP